MSTRLKNIIQRMITATGPLSIAQYMHLCHAHPEHGYYATGTPIGKSGDFITAPEISQMFGEIIAIWAMSIWQEMGSSKQIQIVELGPGIGTLMQDFLRTAKTRRKFYDAIKVKLVETSTSLIKEQKEKLEPAQRSINWVSEISSIGSTPTIFIANEFLDAIPFRQFAKIENKWYERGVGLGEDDNLTFVTLPNAIDQLSLPQCHEDEPNGAIFEIAPARETLTQLVAQHIAAHGGAALLIDYGHETSGYGNTFQAVRAHKKVSPLDAPGSCDLTSHVDFDALSRLIENCGISTVKLQSQSEFLLEFGLLERAGALGAGKPATIQDEIQYDVERLASPQQMGTLFKVLSFKHI